MNEKKIYLVFPDQEENVEEFRFVFASYEEAEAFTTKFKENTDYVITEKVLSPKFITNATQSPFAVSFRDNQHKYFEAYLVDYDEQVDLAHENKYKLRNFPKDGSYHFTQYLFADNMEEATIMARKKLDEVIAAGKIGVDVL